VEPFVTASFVPESEFDPIPESEFVVDGAEIVFDDMLGGSNGACDFSVLESLGNKFDDALLSFTWHPVSVAFISEHSCLL
jgi:hypothetical protein